MALESTDREINRDGLLLVPHGIFHNVWHDEMHVRMEDGAPAPERISDSDAHPIALEIEALHRPVTRNPDQNPVLGSERVLVNTPNEKEM